MSQARDLADLGSSAEAGTVTGESLIINGDMAVAQRGTSVSIAHDGNRNEFSPDRFLFNMNNAWDTLDGTVAQVSDAPEGFSNSLKWTTGTAESTVDSDEYYNITHKIEAQNLQHLRYGTSDAKSVTVSFWVKASVTGTFCLSIYQADGVRNIASTYTINSANTWEYKTVTFAGDTGGTINDDNGEGLRLQWHIAAGSDLTSTDATSWGAYSGDRWAYGHAQNSIATTASATFQLTGCKIEVGSTATPFQHESYGENLAKCHRYFRKSEHVSGAGYHSFGTATAFGSTTASGSLYYGHMRTNPTLAQSGGNLYGAGGNHAISALSTSYFGTERAFVNITSSGLTSGYGYNWCGNNNTGAYVTMDAEL